MTVVHTNGVYLFFVTFDAVRGTDVVSENPSLGGVVVACKGVNGSTRQEGGGKGCKISVDCVPLERRHMLVISLLRHS